jgi:hypothetical protein
MLIICPNITTKNAWPSPYISDQGQSLYFTLNIVERQICRHKKYCHLKTLLWNRFSITIKINFDRWILDTPTTCEQRVSRNRASLAAGIPTVLGNQFIGMVGIIHHQFLVTV